MANLAIQIPKVSKPDFHFSFTNICALWLCLLVIASGCGERSDIHNTQLEKPRVYFNSYSDTLITVDALNAELGTDYTSNELGKPIGITDSPYWLITVGGWYLNNRNIQLQGSEFKFSNPLYPNPKRITEVEFNGPFNAVIQYNQRNKTYQWLITEENESDFFTYQRTNSYHFLVLNESLSDLTLLEIGSRKTIKQEYSDTLLLDWSLSVVDEKLVQLVRPEKDVAPITITKDLKYLLGL